MGDSIRETLNAVVAEAEAAGGEAANTSPDVGGQASGGAAPAAGGSAASGAQAGADRGAGGQAEGGDDGAGGAAEPRADGPARDASGRFASKPKADSAPAAKPPSTASKVAAGPGTQAGSGGQGPAPATAPSSPPPEAPKAPQSWKPLAREKWGNVPPEAQAEVHRREKEVAAALQEAAPARKFHQDFQALVGPYEGMIRAEGGEPLRAIGNLLQTAAALRTAPPTHKAHLVANLVKTFGVPIDALDAALAGTAPPNGQAQPGPAQYQDSRVDQLLARLEQATKHRQESQAQKYAAEVETWAKGKEFFDDVRDDMARAVQAYEGLSLDQAYALALQLPQHKGIRDVLQQREAAEAANASQASTQRARAAGSSLKTQPAGVSPPKPSGSLRDDIEASIAALSGR